ncbi:hypothetical protein [Micromonospora cremea]|uniref:hypothetical protein n=1 Tax=Micromonospora cremea TaxID=709881 RepID=UPI0009408E52|nr:hypothetical protein [Micromonospora cremea]
MDELEAVATITGPGERARRAGELITEHQRAITALSQIRRAALEDLDRAGLTDAEIAERTGVTRQRVGQLLGYTTKIK